MRQKTLLSALFLAFLALFALCSSQALAQATQGQKVYKWVDEKGVIHYSTGIPPEAAGRQADILNSSGGKAGRIEASKTAEQIAAAKKLKEEEEKNKAKAQELDKRVTALHQRYESVEELDAAVSEQKSFWRQKLAPIEATESKNKALLDNLSSTTGASVTEKAQAREAYESDKRNADELRENRDKSLRRWQEDRELWLSVPRAKTSKKPQ